MKGRQKRKKTVVNNLLRKENWELEAILQVSKKVTVVLEKALQEDSKYQQEAYIDRAYLHRV